MHEAGCVEQDVDIADLLRHGFDGSRVAHVEPRRLRHAVLGQERHALVVDIGGDDRCAFACKGQCAGPADADGAGGDEGALAFQAVRHVSSP